MRGALPAPDRTLALRGFLADFYGARLARATEDEERAPVANMLGYALSALGRREEALTCTQEAVEHSRQLAQANPQAFRPDLARSLNNLGAMLSALGWREEALTCTQEAVEHSRQLAQANPQAFRSDLAGSLGAHGSVLLELGRSSAACAAFAEGLRAILPFVRALPAAFGGLASALLQYYVRACQEAGEEPEDRLVEEMEGATKMDSKARFANKLPSPKLR